MERGRPGRKSIIDNYNQKNPKNKRKTKNQLNKQKQEAEDRCFNKK